MQTTKVSYTLEQKRAMASAPLIGLIVLISVANNRMTADPLQEKRQSRAIASVAKAVGIDQAELAWQQKVAKQLAEDSGSRDPASIGTRPDPFDQLRFGVLEGKYSFTFEDANQKVREIRFIEANNDRPKYIVEPSEFLKKYRSTFSVSFETATFSGKTLEPGYLKETYTLFDTSSNRVGDAEFHVDTDGRVLAILIK